MDRRINLILLVIALACAWIGVGLEWWAIWLALWATMNFIAGHEDWEDWFWMPLRYGIPAVVAVSPSWFTDYTGLTLWHGGMGYIACCVAAGVAYPALMKWGNRLPRWRELDGPEAYARISAGALVIGGLTVL